MGDPKKRMELAVLKATVEQVREKYAFSQRRACGVMRMSVATYRYRSLRTDEPLRTRLVGWRGPSRASGIGGCMFCWAARESM